MSAYTRGIGRKCTIWGKRGRYPTTGCVHGRFPGSARCVFQTDTGRIESTLHAMRAVAKPLQFARTFFHDIASLVAPDECRVCEEQLLEVQRAPLCYACLQQMRPQRMALCCQCGESLGFETRTAHSEGVLCQICRASEPPFEKAIAFGEYTGALRDAIHLMKFEGVPAVAGMLAPKMAAAMAEVLEGVQGEVVLVAVPLYRGKRPFNQSFEIVQAALPLLRKSRPALKLQSSGGALRRIKRTQSQSQLTPRQRRLNVKGAFAVADARRIAGKQVLLVDDIYTTGATARECSKVLLLAGAVSVRVVTLARAQRLSAELWSPDSTIHPPTRHSSPTPITG